MNKKNTTSAAAELTLRVQENDTLLKFLLEKITDRSKTKVREILKSGRIVVNNMSTTAFDFQLQKGDTVRVAQTETYAAGRYQQFKP